MALAGSMRAWRPNCFARAEMDAWLKARGATLIGADLDESPMAYRCRPEVLAHHAGGVRVLHKLRLFAVAGAGEIDPWKDRSRNNREAGSWISKGSGERALPGAPRYVLPINTRSEA